VCCSSVHSPFDFGVASEGEEEENSALASPDVPDVGLLPALGLQPMNDDHTAIDDAWADHLAPEGPGSLDETYLLHSSEAALPEDMELLAATHGSVQLESLAGRLHFGTSGWAGPAHWKYRPPKGMDHLQDQQHHSHPT